MADIVDFVRDLATDTQAYLKKHVDPLKAENADLRRRITALEAKLDAILLDRSFEKDDAIGISQADGWRQ